MEDVSYLNEQTKLAMKLSEIVVNLMRQKDPRLGEIVSFFNAAVALQPKVTPKLERIYAANVRLVNYLEMRYPDLYDTLK